MQQIIVESTLGQQLAKLPGGALLCDSAGRALGVFSPLSGLPLSADLQLEPPLSIAQIEELRKERIGKPLSEILKRLGLK
jgi:hypothetical protein